jgi:hypothetical protein
MDDIPLSLDDIVLGRGILAAISIGALGGASSARTGRGRRIFARVVREPLNNLLEPARQAPPVAA